MTRNEFVALCEQYLVAPEIALENDAVVAALAAKDDDAVRRALEEEF